MISITVHSLKKSWLFLIITQVFRDTCFEKNASYHHSNTNSLLLLFRKCFVRKFLKLWCWQHLFETSMLTEYFWNLDVLRICLKLWYWQKVSKTLLLSESFLSVDAYKKVWNADNDKKFWRLTQYKILTGWWVDQIWFWFWGSTFKCVYITSK